MSDTHINPPRWFSCLALCAVGGFTVVYFAGRSGRVENAGLPDVPPPPIVAPVGFEPMAFYQEKCEHCHGPYGMVWAEGFSRRYGAMELHNQVEAMCAGPGNTPLEGAKLEALFSYIRSIGEREVFIAFTAREGGVIKGEVSPGAEVTVIAGGKRIKAEVVENEWTAPLSATIGPAEVTAKREGKTARIDLTTHNSTHSTPAAILPAKK